MKTHMQAITLSLTLLITLFTLPSFASADEIHLKNGGKIEGKVEKQGDKVKISFASGWTIIPADEIKNINTKQCNWEEYYTRLAEIHEGDDSAHFVLAQWCEKQKLKGLALEQYKNTILINPNHKNARKALGYEEIRGKWYMGNDINRAKGQVKLGKLWITLTEANQLKENLFNKIHNIKSKEKKKADKTEKEESTEKPETLDTPQIDLPQIKALEKELAHLQNQWKKIERKRNLQEIAEERRKDRRQRRNLYRSTHDYNYRSYGYPSYYESYYYPRTYYTWPNYTGSSLQPTGTQGTIRISNRFSLGYSHSGLHIDLNSKH